MNIFLKYIIIYHVYINTYTYIYINTHNPIPWNVSMRWIYVSEIPSLLWFCVWILKQKGMVKSTGCSITALSKIPTKLYILIHVQLVDAITSFLSLKPWLASDYTSNKIHTPYGHHKTFFHPALPTLFQTIISFSPSCSPLDFNFFIEHHKDLSPP